MHHPHVSTRLINERLSLFGATPERVESPDVLDHVNPFIVEMDTRRTYPGTTAHQCQFHNKYYTTLRLEMANRLFKQLNDKPVEFDITSGYKGNIHTFIGHLQTERLWSGSNAIVIAGHPMTIMRLNTLGVQNNSTLTVHLRSIINEHLKTGILYIRSVYKGLYIRYTDLMVDDTRHPIHRYESYFDITIDEAHIHKALLF